MKTAVIYKSQYGATKTYAQWIAQDLGTELLSADRVKAADLQNYDTIVYGGGLYAGGVNGISLLTKNVQSIQEKAIYLFTVGSADVTDSENINSIRCSLEKVLPEVMQRAVHIYHFRGGMYYSKLSFLHRIMMNMMMKIVRKKPASQLRLEDRQMLETYGQDIDFTDRKAIAPMISDIKSSMLAK